MNIAHLFCYTVQPDESPGDSYPLPNCFSSDLIIFILSDEHRYGFLFIEVHYNIFENQ